MILNPLLRTLLQSLRKRTLQSWHTQLQPLLYLNTQKQGNGENTNRWLCPRSGSLSLWVWYSPAPLHRTFHTTVPHINKNNWLRRAIFLVQRSICCSPAWDSRIYNITMWVMRKSSYPRPPPPWSSKTWVNTWRPPPPPPPHPHLFVCIT